MAAAVGPATGDNPAQQRLLTVMPAAALLLTVLLSAILLLLTVLPCIVLLMTRLVLPVLLVLGRVLRLALVLLLLQFVGHDHHRSDTSPCKLSSYTSSCSRNSSILARCCGRGRVRPVATSPLSP